MRLGRVLLALLPLAASPAVAAPPEGVDNVPGDVAHSMVACWHAPHEGDVVMFGKPRIACMKAAGGPDGQADLANSITQAIAACSPLRFTPSLGAAIAGRVFLIRFVAPRRERKAMLQLSRNIPWPKPATS